jgi:hypothetical protein
LRKEETVAGIVRLLQPAAASGVGVAEVAGRQLAATIQDLEQQDAISLLSANSSRFMR